jgi:hypothetical protein
MKHVYSTVQAKSMYGRRVTGIQFAELVSAYVQGMNEGHGVPVIRSAWENVMHAEGGRLYKSFCHSWDNDVEKTLEHLPLEWSALEDKYFELSDQYAAQWKASGMSNEVNEFQTRFTDYIRKAWKKVKSSNLNQSIKCCEKELEKTQMDCSNVLNQDKVDFETFEAELNLSLNQGV